jgi:hypothetical protein
VCVLHAVVPIAATRQSCAYATFLLPRDINGGLNVAPLARKHHGQP